MLTIIHGADFHLDSPFSGLTPRQAVARREEQRQLLDRLTQLAQQEQADLVLLSGDLLDSNQVFRQTAQALSAALGNIPCPVFIAPGNHDYYTPGGVYHTLDWPDNVTIFSQEEMQSIPLPQLGCVVHGRAFTAPGLDQSPLDGFQAPKDGNLHIMCLHGDVAPQSRYGPLTPQEIAQSGLTYLALGHIHQYSGLNRAGDTVWAYPGCPEGRGFDELGEKGVLCVQVDYASVTGRFVPLGRRRYEIFSVDITGADSPLAALEAALPPDTGEDVYRVLLTGEGPAPDLEQLHRALAPRFYALTLRDQTHLPQDLWGRREEDTLTGLFLRALWNKCQGQPEQQVYQLAARFGLAALENGEDEAL